jgi:hypothetical protein
MKKPIFASVFEKGVSGWLFRISELREFSFQNFDFQLFAP